MLSIEVGLILMLFIFPAMLLTRRFTVRKKLVWRAYMVNQQFNIMSQFFLRKTRASVVHLSKRTYAFIQSANGGGQSRRF